MLEQVTAVQSQGRSGVPGSRSGTESGGAESLPDLLLIERARGGDERAIEALVRRYSRRLFRVALSVLGESERAEAVVRQAYLAAFADLNRYEPNGKFAAWLTRLSFDEARQLRANTPLRPVAVGTPAGTATALPSLEAATDEFKERLLLEKAIAALPEVFRTVFMLRVVEGVSGIETAASLGVHETTVRTRLYRAQRRLAPDLARRARGVPGLFDLTTGCIERIVEGVLAQRPHGSMLTMAASSP